MKIFRGIGILLICVMCFSETCYANFYLGTWKTLNSKINMTLIIKKKTVIWKINGEDIRNVQFEYMISTLPTSMFLTIYSRDGDEEHGLSLIAVPDKNDGDLTTLNCLTGLYEYSKLLYMSMEESEQGDGLQQTGLLAVDFVKVCEAYEKCD